MDSVEVLGVNCNVIVVVEFGTVRIMSLDVAGSMVAKKSNHSGSINQASYSE
jgi:hypothetical protein